MFKKISIIIVLTVFSVKSYATDDRKFDFGSCLLSVPKVYQLSHVGNLKKLYIFTKVSSESFVSLSISSTKEGVSIKKTKNFSLIKEKRGFKLFKSDLYPFAHFVLEGDFLSLVMGGNLQIWKKKLLVYLTSVNSNQRITLNYLDFIGHLNNGIILLEVSNEKEKNI